MAQEKNDKYYVYVGTYTHGDSEGIYVYELDNETGALEYSSKITGVVNPSFLDIHPSGRYLFSVNEIGDYEGKESGSVTAFYIHDTTGELSFLNQQATGGGAPCHVSVDDTGRNIYLLQTMVVGALLLFLLEKMVDWMRLPVLFNIRVPVLMRVDNQHPMHML